MICIDEHRFMGMNILGMAYQNHRQRESWVFHFTMGGHIHQPDFRTWGVRPTNQRVTSTHIPLTKVLNIEIFVAPRGRFF